MKKYQIIYAERRRMTEDEIRINERQKIQKYIDENNIYQVDFGHYEQPLGIKWIPLKTKRVILKEVIE